MKRLLFSLLFLLLLKPVFGCSCTPYSFCETISQRPSDNVLFVRIIDTINNGIRVKVIEVFKGVESRDTIIIWDGTDFECNGTWSMNASDLIAYGDTFLIAMPKIDSVENVWDIIGDYRRPDWFCNTTELIFNNDSLNGFISGVRYAPPQFKVYTYDYNDFKAVWNSNNFSCMSIVGIDEKEFANQSVSIFPNPSYSTITISSFHKIQSAEIFAVNGKSILKSENKTIDVSALKNGLYFLKIEDERGRITFEKLVKQ